MSHQPWACAVPFNSIHASASSASSSKKLHEQIVLFLDNSRTNQAMPAQMVFWLSSPLTSVPSPAADSHGKDAEQPVQAPRAEHGHRRHAKSLDPTSHSVLVCSQLLWYCKHKSENGEGRFPVHVVQWNHCSYRAYPNASSESPSTPTLPAVFSATISIFLPFFWDREG